MQRENNLEDCHEEEQAWVRFGVQAARSVRAGGAERVQDQFDSPEKRLWRAVLIRTYHDLRLLAEVPAGERNGLWKVEVARLHRWFASRSITDGSFLTLCSMFDLDRDRMLSHARDVWAGRAELPKIKGSHRGTERRKFQKRYARHEVILRNREILHLLDSGLSRKEVAEKFGLSKSLIRKVLADRERWESDEMTKIMHVRYKKALTAGTL